MLRFEKKDYSRKRRLEVRRLPHLLVDFQSFSYIAEASVRFSLGNFPFEKSQYWAI